MIVIPERQLVLLLPWKCASQTLRARLRAHDKLSHPAFFHVNEALGRISHQHLTLASFRALPESTRGYRIAVFVRNPYDRVCSGFMQLRRDVVWQRHAAFPSEAVKATVMRQLDDIALALREARGSASRWFSRLPEEVVLRDGFNTSIPLHPCHCWTHEEGKEAVDFIGHVEQLETDFQRLCREFDLPGATQDSSNVSKLPATMAPGHYRHAGRLDASALARLNRLFAADFACFGYPVIEPPAGASA